MLIFFQMIMLFHYQLNQNTGCKVKFVVNMNGQPDRLSNCHRRQSDQPFYLPRVYPWVTLPMNEMMPPSRVNFRRVTPSYPGVSGF